MESLVVRLVLPPLTVLLAGWLQARLGPGLSGRLVGLPLTSGPFLAVLLLADGVPTAVTAAQGVTAGQLMVVGFTALYAVCSLRLSRAGSLLLAVAFVTVLAGTVAAVAERLPWPAPAVVGIVALGVLLAWRPEVVTFAPGTSGETPNTGALAGRAVLTGALVALLAACAPVLGASLAGVLASLPLVICIVTPATHRGGGARAARALLRGTLAVVPGTVTFAAVVASTLALLDAWQAFGLATAAMAATNAAVAAADSRRGR
ncbi:hypothetical protein ACOCJ5_16540 [Knoellia sp. CPCC 206450]|uniref:hypothetical protein n=1 Tax=Knoellia tibetensis TaxID=3404798 RepID=UPI003B43A85B